MAGRVALLGVSWISSVVAVQYGYNHVDVRRDEDIVAANFQDVEDVELLSPAFTDPDTLLPGFADGTQGPTSDEDLDFYIRSLADRNDWMSYQQADFTSEEGRSFPYVVLSSSSNSTSYPTYPTNETDKVRVWLQGGVHGNEPAGDQAMLAFIGALDANQTWAQSLLSRLDMLVLPRYNPDGIFYFQRTLATNYDPNRDHIKLARAQTRSIKTLFNSFSPHIAVDMHEYGATAPYGGSYYHASDGLYSAAKNLNIHPNIRNLSETLFAPRMGADMEALGLRWEPYVTGSSSREPESPIRFDEAGSDGKIGRNAMGLTQCVTFLIETRGIFLADQEFQRRTVAALTMASSIVNAAAENAEKVYSTVEGAISDFASSGSDIVVTDSSRLTNRTFTMVNFETGAIEQVPITFASTTPTRANLTRARPEAYLIPAAWADLAERLRVSGLEVERLEAPWNGTVETLNILSTEFEDEYYEGVVRVAVTAETASREIQLPAGSFWVATSQKNAALAFVALEPENIDSYASFNIVPVEVGDEYPVYRVMK